MTAEQLHTIRRLFIGISAGMVVLAGLIFWQSYKGRVDIWESQIAGCERAHMSRDKPSAEGWRTAQRAREAAYDRDRKLEDLQAARAYDRIAASFEELAARDCSSDYPKPTPLG